MTKEKAIEYFNKELNNIPIKYGIYRLTLMISFKKAIDIALAEQQKEIEMFNKYLDQKNGLNRISFNIWKKEQLRRRR